ncbi:MAG: helix-turn-helix domain-containing protein [Candidatus Aminicenantes bacterium]|nr:helix-turn-helix domain-containing protein [Candidatus Aminicenantes bacterium]NIM79388.1 helix-turn-helix domain-containing protein [Candidatus Aminicenantes bacterium]NIN18665.1 helix-turn-helix domain-containing protein [Candidatus Aminicenantes bacterium]NIN42554.1 helix-turn-helix domain-containing protein [Candidatus Aminicenantes bacterium]NIN85320.1 helix-turn-helix domain-containing protein [Candidatus Aminicenantes bacterium]
MTMTITKTQRELAKAVLAKVENSTPEEVGNLSVDEIAREFMVNRSTLSRAFRAYYYPTLRRIIIRKRCVTFYLLAFTHRIKSVKEGLEILKISSQGNFTRQFKGIFRCTPGEVVREEKRKFAEIRKKYARK